MEGIILILYMSEGLQTDSLSLTISGLDNRADFRNFIRVHSACSLTDRCKVWKDEFYALPVIDIDRDSLITNILKLSESEIYTLGQCFENDCYKYRELQNRYKRDEPALSTQHIQIAANHLGFPDSLSFFERCGFAPQLQVMNPSSIIKYQKLCKYNNTAEVISIISIVLFLISLIVVISVGLSVLYFMLPLLFAIPFSCGVYSALLCQQQIKGMDGPIKNYMIMKARLEVFGWLLEN